MAISTTIQIGAPVQYQHAGQIKDAAGDLVDANMVCAAVCINNAGAGTTPYPIDLKITGSADGSLVGKVYTAVPYSATAAAGKWNPLTSASNFA